MKNLESTLFNYSKYKDSFDHCHVEFGRHVVKLFLICIIQTGQLNEYTERKEMSSEVICMALGRVPAGEQRSRFLAVGLSDDTVRIISLDPSVSSSYLLG